MILVLLQHANVPFSDWILLFNMPLLFLLSGYLEGILERNEPFFVFLKKKCRRLLIPYLAFEGLNLLLWMAVMSHYGANVDIPAALVSILTCINTSGYAGFYGRLWFWPCLFICELILYWVRDFSRSGTYRIWLAVAGLLLLSWISSRENAVRLPFAMDTAFYAGSFVLMGYAMKDQIHWLLRKEHLPADLLIFAVSAVLLYISGGYGKAACLMFINRYGPFGWSVLAGLSGSACGALCAKWLYIAFDRIGMGKKLLLWYGRNSLAVFPVHLYIKVALTDYLFYYMARSGIGILMRYCEQIRDWYVVFPLMLLGSIPLVEGIVRLAPFMLGSWYGKKRKAN